MRDDVKNLFTELFNLTSKKFEALRDIAASEAQKKFCLDTGKTDELLGLIEKDADALNSVNSLDCDIRKIEDEICRVTGISCGEFPELIAKRKEKIITDLKNKIYDINILLKNLVESREKLAKGMESDITGLDKDIKSICRVMELKKALRQPD